jgi:uncharacterized membrane protein YdjX (TVP38/TMEM64 family)
MQQRNQQQPQSPHSEHNSDDDDEEATPFLTLEEQSDSAAMNEQQQPLHSPNTTAVQQQFDLVQQKCQKVNGKKVVSSTIFTLLFLLVWDSLVSAPEHRLIKPNASQTFLKWVEHHPASGLIWIVILMSIAVVFMIPIGTPLTLGCGYVYKGAYGWVWGITIATLVSMLGSAVGAVCCFLLGRYIMRDTVRKWIRKYPLFDAIDIAATEHGLRIMAMLYLTPILPLGPVAYMCGTTSMNLWHFCIAKIAALPLMMLYVFIGASAGTLIGKDGKNTGGQEEGFENEVHKIEENQTLILSGIGLSFVSIACITHFIRKELNKILEGQKKLAEATTSTTGNSTTITTSTTTTTTATGEASIEMPQPRIARQRKH